MTVNDKFTATSGVFEKYKEPVFPYVIGENYHSIPNEFNFQLGSNQDDYDVATNGWKRNTSPYNLIEDDLEYPYVYIPNKLNQTGSITAATPGQISRIGIVTGGSEYRVGEELEFNNDNTGGRKSNCKESS